MQSDTSSLWVNDEGSIFSMTSSETWSTNQSVSDRNTDGLLFHFSRVFYSEHEAASKPSDPSDKKKSKTPFKYKLTLVL